MNGRQLLGLLLIVGGILGLIFGGFSYTEEKHAVDLGPVELQVEEKERVNIPLWAGVLAVGAGAALLLAGHARSVSAWHWARRRAPSSGWRCARRCS